MYNLSAENIYNAVTFQLLCNRALLWEKYVAGKMDTAINISNNDTIHLEDGHYYPNMSKKVIH